jgi:4-amino-4-deoxy-L-arabinose transferase-like glycosyltransferase
MRSTGAVAHMVALAAGEDVRWRRWLAPVALFLVGLALYSIDLDKPPRFDELYHLLGARGYLEHGEPRIADGVYDRARYFTVTIALLFAAFGESLVVGRLLAVVCGSLLVSLLFMWVRGVAGHTAAWFAAVGFLISPFAAHVAQDLRFYAPFALFFWLGAMAVYAASTAERLSPGRLAWLVLAAAACLGAALYLQSLALIGFVGLGLWLGIQVGLPWLRKVPGGYAIAAIALAIVVGAVVVFAQVWPLNELLDRYRQTTLWAAELRNQFWFYHQWLNLYYPTLWPLFPIAALAALAHRARPALFCLCVFVAGFLLLSFGGQKALLYPSMVFPFLYALWGMAFACVWPPLRSFVLKVTEAALRGLGVPPSALIKTMIITAAVGFVLLANTALIRTATMLAGVTVPPELPTSRWWDVAEPLEPWINQASVVITASDLDALYYLGDYDILLSKSRLSEQPVPSAEFGRDPRTGRPIVSTPESIDHIVGCFPDGLIVVDKPRWRQPEHLDDATADLIVRRTEPISLPSETRIIAFHWANSETHTPEACAGLKQFVDGDRGS